MKDWHEIALTLKTSGSSDPQVTKSLIELGAFADVPYRMAYDRVRKYLSRHSDGTDKPKFLVRNYEPEVYKTSWNGKRIIRFALVGDTHINSKYVQLTHLHDFYDRLKEDGIKTVYHTGDIDDGDQMRMGQQYELYTVGADSHVDEIVRVYPKREGIITNFICGNHDASIYKRCGYDIGTTIADKRKDMNYLGRDCAVINLTDNCSLELRHPWDGTNNTLSYRLQKMIEAMDFNSKPDILAVGHYHKMEQLLYKDVYGFQTACFQSATPFTIGKCISSSVGGWIIEVEVHDDGTLDNVSAKFIAYKNSIKDDYMNFR